MDIKKNKTEHENDYIPNPITLTMLYLAHEFLNYHLLFFIVFSILFFIYYTVYNGFIHG